MVRLAKDLFPTRAALVWGLLGMPVALLLIGALVVAQRDFASEADALRVAVVVGTDDSVLRRHLPDGVHVVGAPSEAAARRDVARHVVDAAVAGGAVFVEAGTGRSRLAGAIAWRAMEGASELPSIGAVDTAPADVELYPLVASSLLAIIPIGIVVPVTRISHAVRRGLVLFDFALPLPYGQQVLAYLAAAAIGIWAQTALVTAPLLLLALAVAPSAGSGLALVIAAIEVTVVAAVAALAIAITLAHSPYRTATASAAAAVFAALIVALPTDESLMAVPIVGVGALTSTDPELSNVGLAAGGLVAISAALAWAAAGLRHRLNRALDRRAA